MLPSELLWLADRLARAHPAARVRILSSGLVATIHPPGRNESDTKLLVTASKDEKLRFYILGEPGGTASDL